MKIKILIGLSLVMGSLWSFNFVSSSSAPAFSGAIPMERILLDFESIQTLLTSIEDIEYPELDLLNMLDTLQVQPSLAARLSPFERPPAVKPTPVVEKRSVAAPPKPVTRPIPKRPQVQIDGIIWDTVQPYAILNGDVHQIGDNLDGYYIGEISDSSITLLSTDDHFKVIFRDEDYDGN